MHLAHWCDRTAAWLKVEPRPCRCGIDGVGAGIAGESDTATVQVRHRRISGTLFWIKTGMR
ncbi:MAG: hypothetical protein K6T87_11955 [Roseiflexus sp.]|uniref:hypothetical protein n=1 Tax=Roseiflexus sp. TaxID=2562120 RepID=UPI0025D6FE24|nr:hypothetical protein [Roseiflexus sp.]MCL6541271.1 hypothetical protein [Roseiflexus sp.]